MQENKEILIDGLSPEDYAKSEGLKLAKSIFEKSKNLADDKEASQFVTVFSEKLKLREAFLKLAYISKDVDKIYVQKASYERLAKRLENNEEIFALVKMKGWYEIFKAVAVDALKASLKIAAATALG